MLFALWVHRYFKTGVWGGGGLQFNVKEMKNKTKKNIKQISVCVRLMIMMTRVVCLISIYVCVSYVFCVELFRRAVDS